MQSERRIAGIMTGTSLDGVDAVVVRVRGAGLGMQVEVIASATQALGAAQRLFRALCQGDAVRALEIARARSALGDACAEAVHELRATVGSLDLVVAHGQTVCHKSPVSWQLLDPWPIAIVADCPVLSDLRGADIARCGEGAPITPAADWVLFRDATETRAIVNLGGFCNVTVLPAGAPLAAVAGFDVCSCNHVLDAAAKEALGSRFDHNGACALAGAVNAEASDALQTQLRLQGDQKRSLGTGDEARPWAHTWTARLDPSTLLATAVDVIAKRIAAAVRAYAPDRVLLGGGSTRNAALVRALKAHCSPAIVELTDAHGVAATDREAAAMAVLGALCMDGVDGTLAHITGARTTPSLASGSWTNLPQPLGMPRHHTR